MWSQTFGPHRTFLGLPVYINSPYDICSLIEPKTLQQMFLSGNQRHTVFFQSQCIVRSFGGQCSSL